VTAGPASPATRTAPPGQEPAYFETLAAWAGRHWWHRARRDLAAEAIRRAARDLEVVVDAGCGAGGMLPVLAGLGARLVVGVDVSPDALAVARRELAGREPSGRGPVLVRAEAERLPLADGSCSAIVSMDVLEHLDDDAWALARYARALRPGGVLVLQVPAYRWLWSDHDRRVGHRRRYTARALVWLVRDAGLEVVRASYYHAWLLPLALVVRRTPLGRLITDSGEAASYVHPAVNALAAALCRVERMLLRVVRLPFGTSAMVVARRPPSS
jgi:SAM-dependent methyltransferase